MKIKNIAIANVKSFRTRTTIEFDSNFNIVIGPNASGKSNLLDIITISLRKFFLISYNQNKENNSKRIRINTDNPFSDLSLYLDKYLGCSDPSLIQFTFIVKSEDLYNLKICKEEKNRFLSFLNSESINSEAIENSFRNTNWDDSFFKEDDLIKYTVIDNQFQLNTNSNLPIPKTDDESEIIEKYKEYIFLKYLNFHELFTLFQHMFPGKEFKPCFLMLSPYRAISSDQDFLGNLSQNSSVTLSHGLRNITSKQSTS